MKKEYTQLPPDECKRLVRDEYNIMLRCMCGLSSFSFMKSDMARRLNMIPNGNKRLALAHGQLAAIMSDIIGTIPEEQKDVIRNAIDDYEGAVIPKGMPHKVRVVVDGKDLAYLVEQSRQNKCSFCTLNTKQCRNCELYKIHSRYIPLSDYDSTSYLCPYNLTNWED